MEKEGDRVGIYKCRTTNCQEERQLSPSKHTIWNLEGKCEIEIADPNSLILKNTEKLDE